MSTSESPDSVAANEMHTVANIDVKVHLVERKVGLRVDYGVVVKTTSCLLAVLDINKQLLTRAKEQAEAVQLALGKALYAVTINATKPEVCFNVDPIKGLQMHITLPHKSGTAMQSTYTLVPISMDSGVMRTIPFMNRVHAEAYSGEFIDELLPDSVNWLKLKITEASMTL